MAKTIYRVEYHVYRPLFTGRFGWSTKFTDLSLKVALVDQAVWAASKFTDLCCEITHVKFTDPSLQITP